jgi:hypothetical protein
VKPIAFRVPWLTGKSTVAQIGAVESNNRCRQQATIDLKIISLIIRKKTKSYVLVCSMEIPSSDKFLGSIHKLIAQIKFRSIKYKVFYMVQS